MNSYHLQPWEQIPFSFRFPHFCVWFLGPEGYIDGYTLDYGSFTPVRRSAYFTPNKRSAFKSKIY